MKFWYTNHKGEHELRDVKPICLTFFTNPGGVNEHLKTYAPGFFLEAYDFDRQANRHFALDITKLVPVPGDGWPCEIGDLKEIKATVDALTQRAIDSETAIGITANIASIKRYLKYKDTPLISLRSDFLSNPSMDVVQILRALEEGDTSDDTDE